MDQEENKRLKLQYVYDLYRSLLNDMFSYYVDQDYNCIDTEYPIKKEKITFMTNDIFDYTTYDGEVSYLIGEQLYSVIQSILNKDTFDFIKEKQNYIYYIMFMKELEPACGWGTSIRGAWFENYDSDFKINTEFVWNFSICKDSDGVYLDKKYNTLYDKKSNKLNITYGLEFFKALSDFIEENDSYDNYRDKIRR